MRGVEWSSSMNGEEAELDNSTGVPLAHPFTSILMKYVLICVFLCTWSLGCTIVHVAGAKPEVQERFGLVNVQIKGVEGQPLIISTKGFGLTLGGNSVTLGWLREVIITAPDDAKCRIFIVAETKDEIEVLKTMLKEIGRFDKEICIFDKEGDKWPN